MSRTPNRIQRIVATMAQAHALSQKCERLLAAKYGFNKSQIQALKIAARSPHENLAVVFADVGQQIMQQAHGPTLQPPRTVFRPLKGSIF